MKTVTRWKHPSTDSALVLEGTPEETRTEASFYFPEDEHEISGTKEQMSDEDFDALPEFEG